MDASFFPVTLGEYSGFHGMDRALYSLLAVELWHNPLAAVQILALWLWLERLGFKNVVKKILSLPHALIDEFADEALTCLSCINNPEVLHSAGATDIPLTSCLLKRKICVPLLIENRDTVLHGVCKIEQVCATVFADLIEEAILKHTACDLLRRMSLSSALEESLICSFANLGFTGPNCSANINGSPTPATVRPVHRFATSGHRAETPQDPVNVFPLQSRQSLIRRFANLGLAGDVSSGASIPTSPVAPEDRSMFITFSKGYPVSEAELTDFFNMVFGDCIESFHMQPVRPGEQALYAQVVFRIPFVVDMVLNGLPKAKFTINGKHLWMRKFVPKKTTRSSSSSSAPAAYP